MSIETYKYTHCTPLMNFNYFMHLHFKFQTRALLLVFWTELDWTRFDSTFLYVHICKLYFTQFTFSRFPFLTENMCIKNTQIWTICLFVVVFYELCSVFYQIHKLLYSSTLVSLFYFTFFLWEQQQQQQHTHKHCLLLCVLQIKFYDI